MLDRIARAESTGLKAITILRSSTATESWWPRSASATTLQDSPVDRDARRCRRQPRCSDPDRDRDPHGLLVAALRAIGRPVFAINPLAVARYRERSLGGTGQVRSRRRDDPGQHTACRCPPAPRLPADSELAQAIAVLARAQQDAVWRRTKASNELRSMLREYYPAFLEVFAGKSATNLAKPEARAVLAIVPTPAHAANSPRPASPPRCAAPAANAASTTSPPTFWSAADPAAAPARARREGDGPTDAGPAGDARRRLHRRR